VLSRYPHLEDIPKDPKLWHTSVRGATKLAATLFDSWNDAILFRTLATLRADVPVFDTVDALRWIGPHASFEALCEQMKAPNLYRRAAKLVAQAVR
jgi:hypothetical protein